MRPLIHSVARELEAIAEPQPQVVVAFGLLNTKPRPISSSLKSMVVPFR